MLSRLLLCKSIAVVAHKVCCTHGIITNVLPGSFLIHCLVFFTNNVVAQGTFVLNIQPFAQADRMEKVSALCDACSLEVLVANGAHIAVSLQLLLGGFVQGSDTRNCSSSVNKHSPAVFGLTPDVKVCMDAHHQSPDSAPRLKEHDPGPIAKQEDAKQEFYSVAQ